MPHPLHHNASESGPSASAITTEQPSQVRFFSSVTKNASTCWTTCIEVHGPLPPATVDTPSDESTGKHTLL
eukprot:5319009-Pyramimonas_sp.AAC.1